MEEKTKDKVAGGFCFGWLALLTIGVIVNLVAKPKPAEPEKGALRMKGEQIQFYYKNHAGEGWDCANEYAARALGMYNFKEELDQLRLEFACLETGGHRWVFDEKKEESYSFNGKAYHYKTHYVFKCEYCGRKKDKSLDDLTTEEREALEKLNIL